MTELLSLKCTHSPYWQLFFGNLFTLKKQTISNFFLAKKTTCQSFKTAEQNCILATYSKEIKPDDKLLSINL